MTTNEQDHEHVWGPVELSRFAGMAHRKCQDCRTVTLDLEDEDEGE